MGEFRPLVKGGCEPRREEDAPVAHLAFVREFWAREVCWAGLCRGILSLPQLWGIDHIDLRIPVSV